MVFGRYDWVVAHYLSLLLPSMFFVFLVKAKTVVYMEVGSVEVGWPTFPRTSWSVMDSTVGGHLHREGLTIAEEQRGTRS